MRFSSVIPSVAVHDRIPFRNVDEDAVLTSMFSARVSKMIWCLLRMDSETVLTVPFTSRTPIYPPSSLRPMIIRPPLVLKNAAMVFRYLSDHDSFHSISRFSMSISSLRMMPSDRYNPLFDRLSASFFRFASAFPGRIYNRIRITSCTVLIDSTSQSG